MRTGKHKIERLGHHVLTPGSEPYLPYGVPSHHTFSRLFRMLDAELRAAFQRFMAGFSEQREGVVAIDGKALRRSFDRASGKSPLQMVSAWGCEQAPKLLKMLRLKGTIVTAEALNCQRAVAQQIVDQGGDDALARARLCLQCYIRSTRCEDVRRLDEEASLRLDTGVNLRA